MWRSGHNKFLKGATSVSCEAVIVDAFLIPTLYHIQVAGGAYKGFEIPNQFDALTQYMGRHLGDELVSACTPPEAMVRWGWANARGDHEAADEAAAELEAVKVTA